MASKNFSIVDVEKVVKVEGKVKDVKITRLTAPGENYISLVLRIDFEVERDGHTTTLSTIAKRTPLVQKEEFQHRHQDAMRNEIRWYSEIMPLLKECAKEYDLQLDFYPEYCGSRYSLDSSKKEVDSTSILLLENLIPQGYKNGDRYIGYDLRTSQAIIKTLVLYHAVPIIMKIKKPASFKVFKDFLDETKEKFPPGHGPGGPKGPPGGPKGPGGSGRKHPGEMMLEAIQNIPEFAPYLTKVKALFNGPPMDVKGGGKLIKEPWNTIVHSDMWVNNIMVKERENKEPLVKIVDFQTSNYGSFANDLVFFLLTSVRNDIAREFMDDLLRLYYEEFTSVMKKADIDFDLTYDDFLEVVKTAAESQIRHAIIFSGIIFGKKGTDEDGAEEEFNPFEHLSQSKQNMNPYHKDKLVSVVSEAIKRNWL